MGWRGSLSDDPEDQARKKPGDANSRSSKYRGVSKSNSPGRGKKQWQATIYTSSKKRHLG